MDKGINIRSVLLLKKAVEILDYLGTKYDIEKLRKRPDICKEIINKFKDEYILYKKRLSFNMTALYFKVSCYLHELLTILF